MAYLTVKPISLFRTPNPKERSTIMTVKTDSYSPCCLLSSANLNSNQNTILTCLAMTEQ